MNKYPDYFIKIYKNNKHKIRSIREKTILNRKINFGSNYLLPKCFYLINHDGYSLSIQSIESGIPIQLNNYKFDEFFFENIKKMSDFQLILYNNFKNKHNKKKNLIKKIFLINKYFDNLINENLLYQLIDYVEKMKIELCLQHLDFNRQNTLLDKFLKKYTIIDWSDSKDNMYPFHDIMFFSFTYYFQGRTKTGIKSFIDLFYDTYNNKNIRKLFKKFAENINQKNYIYDLSICIFLIERILFEMDKNFKSYNNGDFSRFNLFLGNKKNLKINENIKVSIWSYIFIDFIKKIQK